MLFLLKDARNQRSSELFDVCGGGVGGGVMPHFCVCAKFVLNVSFFSGDVTADRYLEYRRLISPEPELAG